MRSLKKVMCLFATVAFVALTAQDGLGGALDWWNIDSMDMVTGDGLSGAAQTGWLVVAYKDSNSNSNFDFGVDTEIAGQCTLNDVGGNNCIYGSQLNYVTPDQIDPGDVLFTVFFNSAVDVPSATAYSVSAGGYYNVLPDPDPLPIVWDAQGDGTWVSVPEPCTFALLGIGALTIAARKKFRKSC